MPAAPTSTAPTPASPVPSGPGAESAKAGQVAPVSPSPAPPSAAASPLNDAFSEIDKIIADTQQKAPPAPGAKRSPSDPSKQVEKPAEPEKPKSEDVKPVVATDETQKLSAPELRKAYAQRKQELKEANERLAAHEAKLKEYEAKVGDGSELSRIQQRLQETEKRAKELEDQIKFVDYEKSPEYKEKYYEPFVTAYQAGRQKAASLKIMERKNDMDEVVQQARKATPEDFDAIMRLQDDGEAAEMADRLFGPMANLVIYHREKIMDLNSARVNAIEQFKKTGSEREQKTAEQMKAIHEKAKTVFKTHVEKGMSDHPQWFKADEADDQGKKMLEQGLLNADSVFTASNQNPEDRAAMHAAFRNMAGAFPFVALKLHRAESRIKELETELEEFKKSTPSEPSRERGAPSQPMSAEEEIEALARAGR